ncbi:AAA family ATPase [Demequina sp. TTPB684]|uniref:AAA family ATPase n=1 Tax=unclassified Demequina TaxID=2620311 RepID=UPI001CF2D91D|nr:MULTISPECIES: AAA family ATPase [unclassified Demequina]MCB2411490.1 AAA family ATPase [Demequina sp. TTPB684]UPU88103.1 AAA family ATPase [Demequina sp. TMPB413]
MKLDKIMLNGYRSLVATSCNVSPPVVALVGLNETGKTSVLAGLAWLGQPGDRPLAEEDRYVGGIDTQQVVVEVRFVLAPQEIEDAVAGLDTNDRPRYLRWGRRVDGTQLVSVEPSLDRSIPELPELLAACDEGFARVRGLNLEGDTRTELASLEERVRAMTLTVPTGVKASDVSGVRQFATFLRQARRHPSKHTVVARSKQVQNAEGLAAVDEEFADALTRLVDRLEATMPSTIAAERLSKLVPRFLLMGEQDRILQSRYEFPDDKALQQLEKPLANLLTAAGVPTGTFRAAVRSPSEVVRTRFEDDFAKGAEALVIRWGSRDVRLHMRLERNGASISAIEEDSCDGESAGRVPIGWRSEGFRAFAAARAFLIAHGADSNTVLLIDEPENHLHYAAQTVLVESLYDLDVQKVIYTTHSPGCLPPDLGTGVRLARSGGAGISKLENSLWDSEHAGFDSLLYAMGAESAAFALNRIVVMCEGETENQLLPSLLRAASGVTKLPYVVAPGVARTPPDKYKQLEAQGGIVHYVVDGDEQGRKYEKGLRAVGVPSARIHRLPKDHALEDLIRWPAYREIVAEALSDGADGAALRNRKASDVSLPRAKTLADELGRRLHGKSVLATEIAQRIEADPDPRSWLTASGAKKLASIHASLVQAALDAGIVEQGSASGDAPETES